MKITGRELVDILAHTDEYGCDVDEVDEVENLIKVVGLFLKKKAHFSELRRAYKEVMDKR